MNLATSYRLRGAELQTSTTVSDAPDAWNLELFAVIPGVPLHLRDVVDTRTFMAAYGEAYVRLDAQHVATIPTPSPTPPGPRR